MRLRGDSGGKRSEHSFEWALRYRVRDATYVSRLTGRPATDPLTRADIGDRFDSSIADLRGGWHLPGGDYGVELPLSGAYEKRRDNGLGYGDGRSPCQ